MFAHTVEPLIRLMKSTPRHRNLSLSIDLGDACRCGFSDHYEIVVQGLESVNLNLLFGRQRQRA